MSVRYAFLLLEEHPWGASCCAHCSNAGTSLT